MPGLQKEKMIIKKFLFHNLIMIQILLFVNFIGISTAIRILIFFATDKYRFSRISTEENRKGARQRFPRQRFPSMQLLPAQVTVKDREPITVNGKVYKSWSLDIVMAGITIKMWVDETGRLLRDSERNGAVLVDLVEND